MKIIVKQKLIEDITSGDFVLSYDENQQKNKIEKINKKYINFVENEINITLSNGLTISSSETHKYRTFAGWKMAKDLVVGDILYDELLNEVKVTSINNSIVNEDFYDLEVQNTHNYYAGDGIVYINTHNSATVSIPWWHLEIEDVVVLKNNAGTDDNRVRKLDYTIQCDSIFYDRIKKNEDITLLSPSDCPELYDAFGHKEFKEIYEKYEKSNVRKKVIRARKLIELIARERLETGRIYIANIDNINETSSWDTDVKMTNLCLEICTPTKPIKNINDPDGEIGVCTLSAVNLLETKKEEYENVCDTIVCDLNSILDLQEYKIPSAANFSLNRRSLGIGITNLAGYLAKNKLSFYSEEALIEVDSIMEQIQFYLLKASCEQAKIYGACPKFGETKYAKGLLPIDWFNKNARALVKNRPLIMDWESLRKDINQYGLRNSTLTAQMPVESSSIIQNSTNGAEPVRSLLTVKKSKAGTLKQIVPNYYKYRNYYDLAFDMASNKAIIDMNAVLQCWIDMAMSTNLYYNYKHYPDGKIPLSASVKDLVYAHSLGLKTLYYSNTPDDDIDFQPVSACAGGGCTL